MANPDAWIARHNVERYQATGKVDWDYLQGLSDDATPTLAKLSPTEASCALPVATTTRAGDSWTSLNLGRDRALDARAQLSWTARGRATPRRASERRLRPP